MRFKEFITEEVKKAEVNWQQWKAAMAASAIQRGVPKGIDAIVYLGIIGDPGNTNIDIRFKRPVQIGMDVSAKGQGFVRPGAAAQYHPSEYSVGIMSSNASNEDNIKVGKDFDILVDFQGEPVDRQNWAKFQDALSDTVSHELMHRGFEIIDHIPDILNRIPEPTKSYFDQRRDYDIPGLLNSKDPNQVRIAPKGQEYFEHMVIYSMFATTDRMSYNDEKYNERVRLFRKFYMDIEGAAKQYVLSYPIPPGSLAALRSEIDGKTPDNIKVEVPIVNNKPTVIITKIDDVVKKGAKAVSDVASKGANAVSNVSDIVSKGAKSASDIVSKGATAVGDVTDIVSKGAKSASDTVSKGAKTVGDKLAVGYKDLLDKISSKKDLKENTNDELDRIAQLSGIKKKS